MPVFITGTILLYIYYFECNLLSMVIFGGFLFVEFYIFYLIVHELLKMHVRLEEGEELIGVYGVKDR